MKKIKVFALLATLFVGIFSNLFTPVVSAADDEKVSITLHKVKDYTGKITNTGKIVDGPYNFLPGITFKAYDVTKEFYATYDTEVKSKPVAKAIEAAVAAVQGTAGEAPSDKDTLTTKEAVGTQTTAGDGSATFSLNAKSGMTTGTKPVPRDAVYLFVEQASDDVETIADNLVVSLPIYSKDTDGNDTVLENIHLYPKNITKEIPFDKEITSTKKSKKQTDFSIGQTINYKLTATIPANIAETKLVNDEIQNVYNFFQFVDTFKTNELTFINANHSVTVSDGTTGTTLTTLTSADYTVKVEKDTPVAGTTTVTTALTTTGISKLAPYANKEISFNYQMKINSLDHIDTGIVNTAKATFGHDGENGWKKDTKEDSETVYTGGYKFVKVDVNNNNKKLEGAEFVVRKSTAANAEYFVATADGGVWTTDKSKATVYTSTGEGIVDVKGLEYGTYQLQETKAPEGYALPTGTAAYTEFVVTEDSYITTSTTPNRIVNTPKGFLPSTGGAGIILFVALGAAMVGLAGVYFTSRRKDA
ncbi:TPA: SpaH/EbpB family LPXTG-anchored major pilin [Streptococcus suis]